MEIYICHRIGLNANLFWHFDIYSSMCAHKMLVCMNAVGTQNWNVVNNWITFCENAHARWWGGERIWASQRFLLPLWISQLATNSCVLKLYIIYIRICVYLCMYIYLWIPKQQRQTLTACMSFAGGLPKFQLNLPQIQSGILNLHVRIY